MNSFAFIGTRDLSPAQELWIGETLERAYTDGLGGSVLHTGAAPGADQRSAEAWSALGCDIVLHLPWSSYEEGWVREMELNTSPSQLLSIEPAPKVGFRELASMHHARWDSLSQGVQKLHMRNVGIVEGRDKVFATPGSSPWGGGTAMGIKIALHLSIEVEVFDPLNRDWSSCGC